MLENEKIVILSDIDWGIRSVCEQQMAKLLTTGRTDLLPKFVSARTRRPFKAFLVMQDGKVAFEFEKRQAKTTRRASKPAEKLDFTGQSSIGRCPRCGGKVFESETQYLCEHSQSDKKPCKFKSGKVILEQTVERQQMEKLLKEGRTDLLPRFVSSKTGRPFAAWLVTGDDGKVTFEFPPREEAG